jgi:hypothetical protein
MFLFLSWNDCSIFPIKLFQLSIKRPGERKEKEDRTGGERVVGGPRRKERNIGQETTFSSANPLLR